MISVNENCFFLHTRHTTYAFCITKYGHPEHLYYGERLDEPDAAAAPLLALKRTAQVGSTISYSQEDLNYSLDILPLEYSSSGCGDFRNSPIEALMPDGSYSCDFLYTGYKIMEGCHPMKTLPCATGTEDVAALCISLKDTRNEAELDLYYTVYEKTDVITRRCVLKNRSSSSILLRNLASMNLDLISQNFTMITFDGGWAKEAHIHKRRISYGITVNSSVTGNSSNRHNPGFFLAADGYTEQTGNVYGFNLIYSGNHQGLAELSGHDTVRVQLGINPHCFSFEVKPDEEFESPEAVMTFSSRGLGGASRHFHSFINEHIVRGRWKKRPRPVLYNNWEACFFKFDEKKLLSLAKEAKGLGAELFVLDDGWFGSRDSDTSGLGDYDVNKKKLPGGLTGLASKINSMGMKFGLWFEPEMVNEDSRLYRAHPEYAVVIPGKKPNLGRNQLVLDLCNPEVRDYIVEHVGQILDSASISYVKWDMNRHITDAYSPCLKNQGEFYHRYICGLYEVLDRIFSPRPHILLESCSSGGNRFDLGMLCYSPQIWASDDTDPIERLKIQGGLSCLYPLSCIGAHVSASPHQQTLRSTQLSTRFNVAAFGCLGYELDLNNLTLAERREIKEQITFYKKYRMVFQYGTFYRLPSPKDNKVCWQCVSPDRKHSAAGFFQTLSGASEGPDVLMLSGLKRDISYTVSTKPQNLYIEQFGELTKHVLPVELNPNGLILHTANKYYTLTDCVEHYRGKGALIMAGIPLNNQFMGSYYNENTRLLGDCGSSLYIIEAEDA